jgi:hypothetical protein
VERYKYNWSRPPRRWQVEATEAAIDATEPTLIHAVTGAGKTEVIRQLALLWHGSVLIAVPTVALVEQTADAIESSAMLYGLEKSVARITVACYNSLPLYSPPPSLRPPDSDLLMIVDEAHKSERPTVLEAVERLTPMKLVGFSATPLRSSKKEDLSLFAECCYSYPPAAAISDGVVMMLKVEAWTGKECTVDEALDEMLRRHVGRRIMVTATSKADAEQTAKRLGGMAVHCGIPRQTVRARIEKLRRGETPCLVFVDLLAEGVDLPWLEVLALRVPIESPVSFCQRVGRVMRSAPGKEACYILDPLDLFGVHSLTPEMALAGSRDEDPDFLPDLHGIAGFGGHTINASSDPMLSGIWYGSHVKVWPESRPNAVMRAKVEVATNCSIHLDEVLAFDGPAVVRAVNQPNHRAVKAAAAPAAERLSAAQAWLRSEVLALMAIGVAQKVKSRKWRKLDPTDKQVAYLERLAKAAAKRNIDGLTRQALNVAYSQIRVSDRGYCSDFIEVLKHVGR